MVLKPIFSKLGSTTIGFPVRRVPLIYQMYSYAEAPASNTIVSNSHTDLSAPILKSGLTFALNSTEYAIRNVLLECITGTHSFDIFIESLICPSYKPFPAISVILNFIC